MSCLTTILQVEERGCLHFTFQCILSPGKKKYQVTALTASPQCFHFVMEERSGNWAITEAPRPPEWIIALQKNLSDAIIAHGSEQQEERETETERSAPWQVGKSALAH